MANSGIFAVTTFCNLPLCTPAVDGFGGLYFEMCHKNPQAVSTALRICADAARQPVLFHCTSGKDRTGVTAALLLSAVGVPRDLIVGDYHESHQFGLSSEHITQTLGVAQDEQVPDSWLRTDEMLMLLGAPKASLLRFFELLEAEYGTTEAYLDSIGCDEVWRTELEARWVVA